MSNDQRVTALLDKLKEQRSSLGKRPKFSPNTPARFLYTDDNYFNMHVERDIPQLVHALAFLLMRQGNHEEACKRLGVDLPFEWYCHSLQDWEEDLKARIEVLQWEARKRTLDASEKKLKDLYSAEGKTAKELDALEELLKNGK